MGRDDDREDASLDQTLPSGAFEVKTSAAPFDATVVSGASAPFDATHASSPPIGAEPVVEPGTVVGRYVVRDRLGSGTMGLVVLAFDATLDRQIALKLVRPDQSGTTVGRQRLLREAQAMAKLAHPNVVTVFEVGTFGDHVYLAMEYVPGTTLADWLPGRTRRELVGAFVAAGHGLAAAHRAGIVHRDFKPSNVLVSTDGRVRVADFGLATAPTGRATTAPVVTERPLSMTGTGSILGTPAYMSPEQHSGQPADARADQFAFCVALYEALYGELPFEGTGYLAYADNAIAGRVRDAPRGKDVPATLRKVLLRGLAADPSARYPAMDALLAELVRDRAAGRRRAAMIAAGLAVTAVAGGLLVHAMNHDDPCALADAPLATLWDATASHALEQTFAASKSPSAHATFERIAHVLAERAASLRAARRDACVATEVRHEQSAELLDRRIQCIDQRAGELRALVGVLADHPESVDRSLEAALSLPLAGPCADRATLLAEFPPPSTPELRIQVAAFGHELDRVQALLSAGKYPDALAASAKLLPEAERADYPPIRARAHLLDASALEELAHYEQAADELRKTGELAAGAHDDVMLAKIWIKLYGILGFRLAHNDQARALEPTVAAAVVRAGGGPELRGLLDNARGAVALSNGDYGPAVDHFTTAARELAELGSNTPRVVSALSNAGTALEDLGRYDEAKTAIEHALAARIEMLGPDHPDVAVSHYHLGSLLDSMGQPAKALAEFQQSTAIDEKALPADSPHIASDLVSQGVLLDELDRIDEARVLQERALAILEQHPADNGPRIINALLDLGNTYRQGKRSKEALATYQRALGLAEASLGADHPTVADILNNLAYAQLLAGDRKQAQKAWLRALAIRETRLGPDHPEVAKILVNIALDAHEHGDQAQTVSLCTRAIAIFDRPAKEPLPVLFGVIDLRGKALLELRRYAEAIADLTRSRDGFIKLADIDEQISSRMALAEALWSAGKHADATAEMQAALGVLQAQPKPDADTIAQARAWLAKRR